MKPKDVKKEVLLAETRIRPFIRQTILEYSPQFSKLCGAEVYFKLENLQYTGSFKVRGAMNKLLSLSGEERARGIVAASTGNHGAALAFGLEKLEAPLFVFVPENTASVKIEAVEQQGVSVRYHGKDTAETEAYARRYAEENGMTYVSPYNDPQIVGGQGTIAVELSQQLDHIDAVFASLGGGGLISGIAGYLKTVFPEVRMVGCSPENSQVMIKSVEAGTILDLPSLPTISDGTAGGVEPGAITFDLCRELVDEYVTVSEEEIKDGLRSFLHTHQMVIEGAAAVAVASYLRIREGFVGKKVVIVICGANIDVQTLKSLL